MSENQQAGILFVAFLAVLPLANGAADWGSLLVSRALGRHLLRVAERRRARWLIAAIVLHVAVDIVSAAAFLAALAFSLAFLMEAVSGLRGFGYDVAGEIARAAERPFTAGLWLTVILFSTLLPTVAHFVAIAFSPLSLIGPDRTQRLDWAKQLEWEGFDKESEKDQETAIAVARWQTYGQGLFAGGVAMLLTIALLGGVGYSLHSIGIAPADGVAWVARWGVRAAGGEIPSN